MRQRNVCVVVTARPSYSRIRSAIRAIDDHSGLRLQLVVAASALLERYGQVTDCIEQDGFEVQAQVYTVVEGETPLTMAKTTGLGLIELATTFDNLKPDIVVTVADRYETISTAISAAYMNIAVAHVQGGEVTGSIDEKVRHAITKLSTLHFVSTELAAERVIRMGEDPSCVFVTGCPSIDLAADVLAGPELTRDIFDEYGGVGSRLDLSSGYVVCIQHPVTTEYEEARRQVLETLHAVADLGVPVLWFWPNVDAGSDGTSKGIRMFRESHGGLPMHFFRNMAPDDFVRLVYNSACLVGNSSMGIRESAYLGTAAVNVGSRQRGRERGGNVIDVPCERDAIRDACRHQMSVGRYPSDTLYGDGKAGERIANLLATAPLNIEKRLRY